MLSLTCGIVKETLKKKKKPTDTENWWLPEVREGRRRGQQRQCQWEEGEMGEGDQRYKPPFVTNWDVLI